MSSSVQCGQAALVGLPNIKESKKNSSSKERETTLANVNLPPDLRVDRKRLKSDDTSGMEVYKISKVSEEQHRGTAQDVMDAPRALPCL